jgi:peptidyl-prolyl cis-trans isomerase A (cyclophilin A)
MKTSNTTSVFATSKYLQAGIFGLLLCLTTLGTPQTAIGAEPTKGAKMSAEKNPHLVMETSMGTIEIELFADKAPLSTANFLKYADEGFFNGTIFHRVISNFMIQGGGFTENMSQKPTHDPIKNEATNGLKNDRGTLAMARTNVVDSATAQFFINVKDNDFLNHSGASNFGYAVFGKVTNGMDVVDKIKSVKTGTSGGMGDVPATPVVIKSVKRK